MTRTDINKEEASGEFQVLRQRVVELEALEAEHQFDKKRLPLEEEQIYKSIFESSTDVILLIDKMGKIIDVNSKFTEITGYDEEELKGKNLSALTKILDKKTIAILLINFLKRMAGVNVSTYEIEMTKKNGERVNVEINARVLRKDGKIIGDLVILRNITDSKRAEAEIRQKSTEIQLINSINEAVNQGNSLEKIIQIVANETRKLFGGNATTYLLSKDKQYLEMQNFNLPPRMVRFIEKLIGSKIPAVRIKLEAGGVYTETLKTGKPALTNDLLVIQRMANECTENKTFHKIVPTILQVLGIRSVISAPLVSDGEVIGLLDISSKESLTESDVKRIQTISEQLVTIIKRKQAEEALYQSEERLRTMMEASSEGLAMYYDNKIFDINEIGARMLGCEPGEMIGENALDFIVPESLDLLRENIAASYEKPYEVLFKKKDGSTFPVEIRTKKITYKGKNIRLVSFRDLTLQKQYNSLLENISVHAPTSMYIAQNNRLKFVNLQFCRDTGYTKEELLAIDSVQLIHPDDRALVRNNTIKMLKNERTEPYGFRTINKKGEVRWVLQSVAPTAYEGQRAYLGTYLDITEQKLTQEALRISEENYRNSIDGSPIGILIFTNDDETLYANKTLLNIYGVSNIAQLSNPPIYYTPESYAEHLVRREKRRVGETCPIEYEISIIRTDGSVRHLQAFRREIIWNRQKQFASFYIDLTEQKQAEKALRASQSRFMELAEMLPMSLFELDMQGKYTYLNKQAIRVLDSIDTTLADAMAHDPLDIFIQEDREKAAKNFTRILMGEEIKPQEYTTLGKDGNTLPVIIYAAPIIHENKNIGIRGVIVDISERKQAEQLYHNIVDNSPVGFFIAQDDKFVFSNQTFQQKIGYSEEELLSISPTGIIYPEDRQHAWDNAVQMVQGKRLEPYEYRTVAKTGEIKWTLAKVALITYKGKEAMMGISIDITERKLAEQMYHTLAESSPVGVYIVQSGKFVFTNHAFQRGTGFTADELLGTESLAIVHPEDRESVKRNAVQMLKNERFLPYEFRIITKSEEAKWSMERTTSITYEGKRATLGNLMDISERKETEERLEQAALEWRTTFDSITDLISIHDKDNRILRVNKAMADMLKTTPKELIGKYCHEVMHGAKEPPVNCPHWQTLKTGKPSTIETSNLNLGIHFHESTSPLFNEKGELTGSVVVSRDITKQKKMEEQLIVTDRLASIGELASGIAHELNNPLTSVIGFSQLLMEGEVPPNMKEDLSTVYSEAQRAAVIVRNLLTFARKHTPVKQLSHVNAIVEDVLRLRAYEQKVNNIEVERRLSTNLPEIMADHFQLQQVFLNIIVNAEFAMLETHRKGKLVITTEKSDGVIKVSFTDDGPGITEENLKRIFDPFFTTKEVGKGTGLGLSICHGIVTEHGGKIYARSEEGQGSTFVVELPLSGQ